MKRRGGFFAASLAAALLAVAVFLLPQRLEASGCGNYYYSQPSYYQPYSYGHNYQSYSYTPQYQYVTKYVDREVLVPYAVKATVSPDYYFSTSDYYREQAQSSRDQLLTDAAAFRAVQAILGLQGRAGGSAGGLRAGASVPAPGDRAPATSGTPPGLTGGGVPAGLQEVVDAKCIRCHGGSDPKRLNLSNLAAVQRLDRFESWERVNSGDMPKGGQPLGDNEEKLFRAWAKSR